MGSGTFTSAGRVVSIQAKPEPITRRRSDMSGGRRRVPAGSRAASCEQRWLPAAQPQAARRRSAPDNP